MAHDHHHGHDHDHGHHHDHDHHDHAAVGHVHAPASFGRAFAIGIALNLAYLIAETGFGITANALSLIADAGHNLGDVLGLIAAWIATVMARRLPSARFTYGYGRFSVLVALGNAVTLLVATGGIAWEAILRLMAPEPVASTTIMAVAGAGVLVNGLTALLFMAGSKDDLNIRAAFLHLAGDAAISLGVVISGGLILLTGWSWIDPAVSLAVGAAIVAGTWSVLREAMRLSLDAVPHRLDPAGVQGFLAGLEGVSEVHDLHIWGLSTSEVALTVHLVCADTARHQALALEASHHLRHHFRIGHATVQIETPDTAAQCALRPAHVI